MACSHSSRKTVICVQRLHMSASVVVLLIFLQKEIVHVSSRTLDFLKPCNFQVLCNKTCVEGSKIVSCKNSSVDCLCSSIDCLMLNGSCIYACNDTNIASCISCYQQQTTSCKTKCAGVCLDFKCRNSSSKDVCHSCVSGFYGEKCSQVCSAKCNGSCFDETGYCKSCEPGRHGRECQHSCPTGCSACHARNGSCVECLEGFTGRDCSSTCSHGLFGRGCKSLCSENCVDNKCDPVSGSCGVGCKPGFFGKHCLIRCPDGTYGLDCLSQCSITCATGTTCHHVTGSCLHGCSAGFHGEQCSVMCSLGTFGENCNKTCSQNCLLGVCEKVSGHCSNCVLGREGLFCEIRQNTRRSRLGLAAETSSADRTVLIFAGFFCICAISWLLLGTFVRYKEKQLSEKIEITKKLPRRWGSLIYRYPDYFQNPELSKLSANLFRTFPQPRRRKPTIRTPTSRPGRVYQRPVSEDDRRNRPGRVYQKPVSEDDRRNRPGRVYQKPVSEDDRRKLSRLQVLKAMLVEEEKRRTENARKDEESERLADEHTVEDRKIQGGFDRRESRDKQAEGKVKGQKKTGQVVARKRSEERPTKQIKDRSTERSLTKDRSTERGLSRDRSTERLIRDRSTDRGFSRDQSTKLLLNRDRSKERLLSRDRSKERLFSRDRSKERGVSKDQSTEGGLSRDRSTERGLTRDRSTERGLTRDRSTERGLTRDRSTERGLTRDRSTERGLTRDRSTEREFSERQIINQTKSKGSKLSHVSVIKEDRKRPKHEESGVDRSKYDDQTTETAEETKKLTKQKLQKKELIEPRLAQEYAELSKRIDKAQDKEIRRSAVNEAVTFSETNHDTLKSETAQETSKSSSKVMDTSRSSDSKREKTSSDLTQEITKSFLVSHSTDLGIACPLCTGTCVCSVHAQQGSDVTAVSLKESSFTPTLQQIQNVPNKRSQQENPTISSREKFYTRSPSSNIRTVSRTTDESKEPENEIPKLLRTTTQAKSWQRQRMGKMREAHYKVANTLEAVSEEQSSMTSYTEVESSETVASSSGSPGTSTITSSRPDLPTSIETESDSRSPSSTTASSEATSENKTSAEDISSEIWHSSEHEQNLHFQAELLRQPQPPQARADILQNYAGENRTNPTFGGHEKDSGGQGDVKPDQKISESENFIQRSYRNIANVMNRLLGRTRQDLSHTAEATSQPVPQWPSPGQFLVSRLETWRKSRELSGDVLEMVNERTEQSYSRSGYSSMDTTSTVKDSGTTSSNPSSTRSSVTSSVSKATKSTSSAETSEHQTSASEISLDRTMSSSRSYGSSSAAAISSSASKLTRSANAATGRDFSVTESASPSEMSVTDSASPSEMTNTVTGYPVPYIPHYSTGSTTSSQLWQQPRVHGPASSRTLTFSQVSEKFPGGSFNSEMSHLMRSGMSSSSRTSAHGYSPTWYSSGPSSQS